MSEKEKIKVVWICSVSNEKIRGHLDLGLPLWQKLIKKLFNKDDRLCVYDIAVWNTNALKEFEKIDNVDLHVIIVHYRMCKKVQCFQENGINYYVVSDGDGRIFQFVHNNLFKSRPTFNRTWKLVNRFINEIQPDVIHLMGAENPSYSMSILSCPKNIPIITQLQTFLHDPNVFNYRREQLKNQIECERQVLLRTDYFGSGSSFFPKLVRENLKENPVFVNTRLLLGENMVEKVQEKKFDFVYFANNVNKDIDLVMHGFIIACVKYPDITLDIVGGITEADRNQIMSFTEKYGLRKNITIEGRLPSHSDVILQIRKSRFALLPLKTDLVSGTIREAMWNGLPVVTTITQATPGLNKNRESVLLSQVGDHNGLANNMVYLVENPDFAIKLAKNAAITVEEIYGNNAEKARGWVKAYYACMNNFRYGTPLPVNILNNN